MYRILTMVVAAATLVAAVGGLPVLAEPRAADGPNLLVNPGFEAPFAKQCCHTTPGFLPNTPIDEVQVALGWRGWWLEPRYPDYPPTCDGCTAWHRPEWREAAPFANRIRSGANAQKYFTFFSTHQAGMYQQVSGLIPGQRLRFSIYMHAWSTIGSGLTSTVTDNDIDMKVGIDPFGGVDPWSSRIVWSTPFNAYDVFKLYTVEALAQNTTVTVFTHSRPRWGMEHNDIYLDDASLVVVGADAPAATAAPTATPLPAATSTPVPTAAPTVRPTAAPSFVSYTVQRGDSLSKIARRFDTAVSAIIALNDIPNPSRIFVGQVIRLPAGAGAVPTAVPAVSGTSAAVPAGPTTTYRIQRGDTLSRIAREFDTTVAAILAANPGLDANRIFAGVVISIPGTAPPPANTYVVARGDTLHKIATRFGTTYGVLQALNGLPDPNRIYVGQTLIVP